MSPKNEPRLPVKEKNGSGTGMGMLIPTCPTSISVWNLRAAVPLRVKIAVPFPYRFSFTSAMASSRESTCMQERTGPKISVW